MIAPRILLVGLKHSGKSTVGRALARDLDVAFFDLDDEILRLCDYAGTIRELYQMVGGSAFRGLEAEAAHALADRSAVVATGGGTIENDEAMAVLQRVATVVFLDVSIEILVERVFRAGVPAFVDPSRPEDDFREICERRRQRCLGGSDFRIVADDRSPTEIATQIRQYLQEKRVGWE